MTSLLLLLPGRADAAETAGRRLFDLSWFFLRVGLFSFGGAYAVLNVVVVVLGGGALGLLRAFAPALFGGPLG